MMALLIVGPFYFAVQQHMIFLTLKIIGVDSTPKEQYIDMPDRFSNSHAKSKPVNFKLHHYPYSRSNRRRVGELLDQKYAAWQSRTPPPAADDR